MKDIPNQQPLYYYSDINIKEKGNKIKTRKATFAGVLDNNTLKIAKTICSNKDVFDKKLSRIIATGRAIKKPIIKIDLNDHKNRKVSDIFVETCKELLK